MKKDCIFCKIVKKEILTKIVDESNNFLAFLDAYPKAEGHTLIIPKKHYTTILDIPNKLGNEMLQFIKKVSARLLEEKKGDGFNIIMNNLPPAGQVIFHSHIHIIPRKEGDNLKVLN